MKKLVLLFLFIVFAIESHAQVKHIITSDSVDLYVTIKGKGTPCLYIHGGPGMGSYSLEKFAGDSFETHFQMIYLDQRGVGRSSSPKDKNYSMDRMIKDFEEVREALGIEQWITLGHSFGGILQMAYILHFPKAINGMIMINCTLNLNETYKTSWCPKACEFLNISNRQYFENDKIPLIERWDSLSYALSEKDLMWKMMFANRKEMEPMRKTYSEIKNWNWEFAETAMTINDYLGNFLNETSKINVPVLFFYGKKDWMIGQHYKEVKFSNCMFWGSDVGHMPFVENKGDMLKAIRCYKIKYKF